MSVELNADQFKRLYSQAQQSGEQVADDTVSLGRRIANYPRKLANQFAADARWKSDPNIEEMPVADLTSLGGAWDSAKALGASFISSDLDKQSKLLEKWGATLSQDSYGNPVVIKDGKPLYINKPGLSWADARDLSMDALWFIPAGMLASIPAKIGGRVAAAGLSGTATEYTRDPISDIAAGEEVDFNHASNLLTGGAVLGGQLLGEVVQILARAGISTLGKPRQTKEGRLDKQAKSGEKLPRVKPAPIYKTTSAVVRKKTGRLYELTEGVKKILAKEGIDIDDISDDNILALNDLVQNSVGNVDRTAVRTATSDIPMTNLQAAVKDNVLDYDTLKQMNPIEKLHWNQAARRGEYGDDIRNKLETIDDKQIQSINNLISDLAGTKTYKERLNKEVREGKLKGSDPKDYEVGATDRNILDQSELYDQVQNPAAVIKQQANTQRTGFTNKADLNNVARVNELLTKKNLKNEDVRAVRDMIRDSVKQISSKKVKDVDLTKIEDPTDYITGNLRTRGQVMNNYDDIFRAVVSQLGSIKNDNMKYMLINELKKSRSRYYKDAQQYANQLSDKVADIGDLEQHEMAKLVDELFDADIVLDKSKVDKIYYELQNSIVAPPFAQRFSKAYHDKLDTGLSGVDRTQFEQGVKQIEREIDRAPFVGSTGFAAVSAFREQVLKKAIYPAELLRTSPTSYPQAAQQLKLISDHLNETLTKNMPIIKAAYGYFGKKDGNKGAKFVEQRLTRLAQDLDSVAKANYGNWSQVQQTNFKKKVEAAFNNFADISKFPAPTQLDRTKFQDFLAATRRTFYGGTIGSILGITSSSILGVPEAAIAVAGGSAALGSNIFLSPKSFLGSKLSKILEESTALNQADSMIKGSAPFERSLTPYSRDGAIPTGIRALTYAGAEQAANEGIEEHPWRAAKGLGTGAAKTALYLSPAISTYGAIKGAPKAAAAGRRLIGKAGQEAKQLGKKALQATGEAIMDNPGKAAAAGGAAVLGGLGAAALSEDDYVEGQSKADKAATQALRDRLKVLKNKAN